MIKSRAITSYKGIMSRVGITAQIGIGGGGGSSGSLFDGTYAFYPFATNGNNTVTAGAKINERLGDKIFNNDSGGYVTVGEYETAYTGSGELDEPSATNSAEPDLLNWTPTANVNATLVEDDFVAIQVLTDSADQPMVEVNTLVTSLTGVQTFSVFADKAVDDLFVLGVSQSSPAPADSTAVFNLETQQVVSIAAGFEGGGVEKLNNNLWRVYVAIDVTAITGNITLKVKCTNSADNTDYTIGTIRKAKFANLVEGSYPTSYIDTLNGTRDSDKAAVPTSDVWVDGGCFSSSRTDPNYTNGIQRASDSAFNIIFLANNPQVNGKYVGNAKAEAIGAFLLNDPNYTIVGVAGATSNIWTVSHPNNTLQELIDLFGNDGTSTNLYPIAFQYSSLTLAETTQLRADVGDTPPTEYPDGSFRWLDWPAVDVAFQLDFTLYSDEPNELFHIEWANAAKDTYVARTGDALEFNHGNDTLTIPYANLIVLGDTYTGYAVITATELIGFVNGVEVARMTRTDTALAEWSSKCYEGGFNNTLAPVKLAKLKVLDYVVTPPPTGLVVVDGEPLTGQAGSSAYYTGSETFGSLVPPVVVGADTIGFIYTINEPSFGGKITDIGNDDGITGTDDLLVSFDGQQFTAVYNNGGWRVVSDVLYDYLLASQNTPIDFTAEVA